MKILSMTGSNLTHVYLVVSFSFIFFIRSIFVLLLLLLIIIIVIISDEIIYIRIANAQTAKQLRPQTKLLWRLLL